MIANLLQALYGGADLFVVGWFDDAASVAAVAIGSQVMQTITGIILGLTTGTTVVIAMATGAKIIAMSRLLSVRPFAYLLRSVCF